MIRKKCPKCGSDCYIWFEGEIVTEAFTGPINREFLIYCINDCGVIGTVEGKIILNKKTLKMDI